MEEKAEYAAKLITDSLPRVVGSYILRGEQGRADITLSLTYKPKWIHRFFTETLMGWKWIDEPKRGKNK